MVDDDEKISEETTLEALMDNDVFFLSSDVSFIPALSCLSSKKHGDIHLTPNELRLLSLIISGKCKKEIIQEEIWLNQGTVVSESSYHQLIKMLRRKLEKAGLPSEMIKTRPRYGVFFVPSVKNNKILRSEIVDVLEEEELDTETDPIEIKEPTENIQVSRLKTHLNQRILSNIMSIKGVSIIFVMLVIIPPSLIFLCFSNQDVFQKRFIIGNVSYHFYPSRDFERENILMKRNIAHPSNINNVYIATNGPRVFIAECEGEMSREGKCHYEYNSSY